MLESATATMASGLSVLASIIRSGMLLVVSPHNDILLGRRVVSPHSDIRLGRRVCSAEKCLLRSQAPWQKFRSPFSLLLSGQIGQLGCYSTDGFAVCSILELTPKLLF